MPKKKKKATRKVKMAKVPRKPLKDSSCPICFEELAGGGGARKRVHYCQYGCGQGVHATCLDQWKKSKQQKGQLLCVLCRAPWNGMKEVEIP
jgi:hypothetical protein